MLVIGAAGLVGGNLLHQSSRYPWLTIPVFHSYLPDPYRQSGRKLDITSPAALQKIVAEIRPDCVVNLSCMAVAACEEHPDDAYKLQTAAVGDLARFCREYSIRLLHLSTDMVYSGEKGMPYTLDDEPDPISVYGRTKRGGEEAIQAAGGNCAVLRCALVLGRGRFRKAGFLDWMIDKTLQGGPLKLYADQLRTPLVVDDLVDVIFRLAASSFTGILLAGGDEGLNRVEIGEKLLSSMRRPSALIKQVLAAEQTSSLPLQRDLRLDNSRLKEIIARERFTGIEDYFIRAVGSDLHI